ncbi:hypothetical protein C1646_761172, partial [Rhizophagus diaphanus]
MSTELELLRQRISELETKNAKLEAEKAEIEARNVELLKQARLLMLEQGSSVVDGQSQNDRETIAEISAVDESDSVIDQQNDVNTKSMEEVPEVIAEQSVPDKIEEVVLLPDQGGSLEDREMDAFLDEEHKKRISEEIRQRKREKKLREGDSREKNLDSEPLIADISGIDSQDS